MTFSVWDYVAPGVLVPFGTVISLLVLATITGRIIAKRTQTGWMGALPLCIWLMVTLGGITLFAKGMEYPITAWIQADYPICTTTGQVKAISSAPAPPVYGPSLQPAVLLEVDGKAYYVLRTNVEEGEWVKIQWATDARIVYALDKSAPDSATINMQTAEQRDDETPSTVTLGEWMIRVFFLLSFAVIILQYLLGKRIARLLMEKDRLYTDAVFPNRYGLFHYGVILCVLCGILLGMYLTGFHGAGVVLVIGLPVMTCILVRKQTITVKIQEEELVYKVLHSEQRIPLDHIVSAEWGRSGIPFNRQLVIHLRNGQRIILQQEHHLGIEHLFSRLQQRLDQEKE